MNTIDAFQGKEDVILGKGVSEEEILFAERELDLRFADDYRAYLRDIGLVMCNGHELTGIGKAERTYVVFVTKRMKELHSTIPNDWYVVENENMDGALIWQDSLGNIYFNTKKIFSSLMEYIADF